MSEKKSMAAEWATSPFAGGNAPYIEEMYEVYLNNPAALEPKWRDFFDKIPATGKPELSHRRIEEEFKNFTRKTTTAAATHLSGDAIHERKQMEVVRLINSFRLVGHLQANIEPLGLNPPEKVAELTLANHGFTAKDKSEVFDTETFVGNKTMPLGELFDALNETYCGSVGTEFMHIDSLEERRWIQQRIESARAKPKLTADDKIEILELLTKAEGLEKYLGAKFPGAKRFSLEGGDALIVMLDRIIKRAGAEGVKEAIIGMAHRGRLNALVNILGKRPADLFGEFQGRAFDEEIAASGDVKYHQGFSSDMQTDGGPVHVSMAFNPSHLEIVSPVVAGSVRARLTRRQDTSNSQVLSIAVHGDSAIAGQGVVMETFNMSCTRGYTIGGTLHIVVNNQVGFTTSNPLDTRSTRYCTEVAKVVQAPIFHVNADDPEAVYFVTQLAVDYRMTFKKDVVIDLICYRRHGHNEADEPMATQPVMYHKIRQHPTVRKLYATQLDKEGVLSLEQSDELMQKNRDSLDQGDCVVPNLIHNSTYKNPVNWSVYFVDDWREKVNTTIKPEELTALGQSLTTMPEGHKLHPRVNKIIEDRIKMYAGELPFDWGAAENLAYASLLTDGFAVRISGQDSGRGTFFHRHAVLHDQTTGDQYIPHQEIAENSGVHFEVIDSVLSEEAVLAFEYGYSCTDPNYLTIWEAQFGDFANGAQVVIDQFISSGQQKWGRLCGMVLLLPHGYEGQGPEHSSARLERFMQLCAEHNMQVCVPSTPAQVFHMLRRQMKRNYRRPLIVMSPKSLLRHKEAVSTVEDITKGSFKTIIEDNLPVSKKIKRVVLCSGKIFYELRAARDEQKREDVAIVRIEQLYPFPEFVLKDLLATYAATDVVWCQEEPKNQGAWYSTNHHFIAALADHQTLTCVSREPSAAPAVGRLSVHNAQQAQVVKEALG